MYVPMRLAALAILVLSLVAPALAAPVVTIQTIKQKTKYETVDVQVPQFKNPTAVQRAINARVLEQARKDIAAFKKASAQARPEDKAVYDLTIHASTKYLTDRWFAFQTVGGEYTGGAHPSPIIGTYVFDLNDGREVRLKDVFKAGSPYLQTLAGICKKEVEARKVNEDAEWVRRGTEPVAANYGPFYIDGKNLVVVFPQYQVAPYSEGFIEIKIPYAKLASMANANGPLARR